MQTCVQIFVRLIKDWCTGSNVEEKARSSFIRIICCLLLMTTICVSVLKLPMFQSLQVPGFRSFIIEIFAMNCCFYSVLDKSFEFRDANSVRFHTCYVDRGI